MRIAFDQRAVHEGAGVALVGVADEVARAAAASRQTSHFTQVGKPAPPRPRRPASLTVSTTSRQGRPRQRLEGPVAAAGEVVVDLLGVDDAAVAQHDAHLVSEHGVVGKARHAGKRRGRRRRPRRPSAPSCATAAIARPPSPPPSSPASRRRRRRSARPDAAAAPRRPAGRRASPRPARRSCSRSSGGAGREARTSSERLQIAGPDAADRDGLHVEPALGDVRLHAGAAPRRLRRPGRTTPCRRRRADAGRP